MKHLLALRLIAESLFWRGLLLILTPLTCLGVGDSLALWILFRVLIVDEREAALWES